MSATAHPPAGDGPLPDFCAPAAVFLVVLGAELLALLLTLAGLDHAGGFWIALGLISLFVQWVVLSSAALLCGLARRLRGWRPGWLVLLAFAAIQLVTLFYSLLVVAYAPQLGYAELRAVRSPELFLASNLAISGIGALLLLRYLVLHYRWHRQLLAEAEARMLALQARIRPHFLFNSLNTIAQLIRVRPEQAEEAVLDLADLFRAALRGRETLTLEQELELTRGYLRLQQLRFGERLRVEWRLADDLPLQAPVPALILQPLVENAVNHGVQPVSGPVTVRIAVDTVRDALAGRLLRFEIVNPVAEPPPGLPLGKGEESSGGAGMALDNVRQRLALAGGERARLTAVREDGEFRVRLTLPVGG